jgi:hypothetical protein
MPCNLLTTLYRNSTHLLHWQLQAQQQARRQARRLAQLRWQLRARLPGEGAHPLAWHRPPRAWQQQARQLAQRQAWLRPPRAWQRRALERQEGQVLSQQKGPSGVQHTGADWLSRAIRSIRSSGAPGAEGTCKLTRGVLSSKMSW